MPDIQGTIIHRQANILAFAKKPKYLSGLLWGEKTVVLPYSYGFFFATLPYWISAFWRIILRHVTLELRLFEFLRR